jgi:glyoxylase-like metal-dependent hydrolase (beta-lactamase superfamily II)
MEPILLPAGNPSLWTGPTGNNTYLIPGRIPTLIDAGVGASEHLDAIGAALEGRDLALVLITHGHSDHISGAPAITRRWPDVRLRRFGVGPAPIEPDEAIDAGDATITAVHTPGHSPDHCCFLLAGDLFCGDLARIGGTVVIPASHGGNLAQYLDSLRRVRAMKPRRLLPGHGPVIENPTAVIDEYLRHRAERELQILEAMRRGRRTVDEIVSQVYPGLRAELVRAAAESATAHLLKLRSEGLVTERDGEWKLTQAG